MSDVIDLIERDHREVEELFAKFNATGEVALAAAICDRLECHALAEEVALAPVVAAEVPNGRQMAGEDEDEHTEVLRLVARIRETPGPCDELARLVLELELLVEEHVDAEETEVLPQVRAVLDPAHLVAMGREFEDAKHSSVPHPAPARRNGWG